MEPNIDKIQHVTIPQLKRVEERYANHMEPTGGIRRDAMAYECRMVMEDLLSYIDELTARAEKAEAERDAYRAALQNWHEQEGE